MGGNEWGRAEPVPGQRAHGLHPAQGLPSDLIRTLHRDTNGVLVDRHRWRAGAAGRRTVYRLHPRSGPARRGHFPNPGGRSRAISGSGATRESFGSPVRASWTPVAAATPRELNPIAYGRAEGMERLECTGGFHPAGLKTRDGKLWFSTVKGLVMVDPGHITVNEVPPTVVSRRRVRADGVIAPGARSGRASARSFGPASAAGGVPFTALSLVAPERNRFKYRLEGLDRTGWKRESQRSGRPIRIWPRGATSFESLACNNDGVWNEPGQHWRSLVLPAFWQTWWFRVLARRPGAGRRRLGGAQCLGAAAAPQAARPGGTPRGGDGTHAHRPGHSR